MRIRYESTRATSPSVGEWLVDGAEYLVLEVSVNPTSADPTLRCQFRLVAEDTPILVDARCFGVVDGTVPTGWVAEIIGDSLFLGPDAWLRWDGQYSFWEDYWSDNPAVGERARLAFSAELLRMAGEP